VERLAAAVFALPTDTAEDLMETFGITPGQAGSGSPDLACLLAGDTYRKHLFSGINVERTGRG
jgi:hypothetical protein